MATLTFQAVTDAKKLQDAKNGNRLTGSKSPFTNNVTFTVTGHTFVQAYNGTTPQVNGANQEIIVPVLTTTIGNLFVSMLQKPKIDYKDNLVKPEGTFVDLVNKIIAENADKTDDQILTAIVEQAKDKQIQATWNNIIVLDRWQRRQPSHVVNFNFVEKQDILPT